MESVSMSILKKLASIPKGNCFWDDPMRICDGIAIPDMANELHIDMEDIDQIFAFLEESKYVEYVSSPFCGYEITHRGKHFVEFQKDSPNNEAVLDFSQIELDESEIGALNRLEKSDFAPEFTGNRFCDIYLSAPFRRLIRFDLAESFRQHIYRPSDPISDEPVSETDLISPSIILNTPIAICEDSLSRPRKVCDGYSGSYVNDRGSIVEWRTTYTITTRGRDYLSYLEGKTRIEDLKRLQAMELARIAESAEERVNIAKEEATSAKKQSWWANLFAFIAIIVAILAWLFPRDSFLFASYLFRLFP